MLFDRWLFTHASDPHSLIPRCITHPPAQLTAVVFSVSLAGCRDVAIENSHCYLIQVEEIVGNFEVESGQLVSVKGNLKANIEFWKSIGTPNFIISIVDNGYSLPFVNLRKLRNNKSARLYADFVDQTTHELVSSGRVRIVDVQPLCKSFVCFRATK